MENIKSIVFIFAVLVLMTNISAQTNEDLKPGITPDSFFYFLDTMFEGFQSSKAVANEKVAEIIDMAQENKIEALEKARERYEKVMQKRNREAEETEKDAEEVARQAGYHLKVLMGVYEKVSEQAKVKIEKVMQNNAESIKSSTKNLNRMNSGKGVAVFQEVLRDIISEADSQGQGSQGQGSQIALNSLGVQTENSFKKSEGL